MIWHVVPKSVDTGELGLRLEAESAEAAAALAIAGPYAAHAGERMVVRWNPSFDRHGELLCARVTEVSSTAPAVAPASEAAAPAPEVVAREALVTTTPAIA